MGGDLTIVLDTCALLWWSLDPDEFSPKAKAAVDRMEREKDGLTPAIAIWEIAIKVRNKKLDLGTPLDIYLKKLKQSDVVEILAVNEDVFLISVDLEWSHRDPVDRIMVALAMEQNCPIITRDKEIRKFYDNTIW